MSACEGFVAAIAGVVVGGLIAGLFTLLATKQEHRNAISLKRFSKLHEIRAQIIADLYGRLYEFHWAVCAFLRDFHKANHDAQRVQELDAKSYDFKDFFDKHRIYFTENIYSKIDALVNSFYSAYVPLVPGTDRNDNQVKQDWNKCAKIVKEKCPEIIESLERDFRKILGVTESGEELNQ
jgi:hypothetical protein